MAVAAREALCFGIENPGSDSFAHGAALTAGSAYARYLGMLQTSAVPPEARPGPSAGPRAEPADFVQHWPSHLSQKVRTSDRCSPLWCRSSLVALLPPPPPAAILQSAPSSSPLRRCCPACTTTETLPQRHWCAAAGMAWFRKSVCGRPATPLASQPRPPSDAGSRQPKQRLMRGGAAAG